MPLPLPLWHAILCFCGLFEMGKAVAVRAGRGVPNTCDHGNALDALGNSNNISKQTFDRCAHELPLLSIAGESLGELGHLLVSRASERHDASVGASSLCFVSMEHINTSVACLGLDLERINCNTKCLKLRGR